jgi:hypothetical protein
MTFANFGSPPEHRPGGIWTGCTINPLPKVGIYVCGPFCGLIRDLKRVDAA